MQAISYDDLVRAAQVNDAIMEERGEQTVSWQEVTKDLQVDIMGLMAFAFEYAGKQSPRGADELFEMLHLACCYGSITTARALKRLPLANVA